MTTPLDRIADALELLALTTWRDSPSADMVCDALANRIEARHAAAQQTPANAPLVQPGDDSRFNPLAPTGGDSGHLSSPPDDDPEWRDVPVERAAWNTVREGDRFFTARGEWAMAIVSFADVEKDYDTRWSEIWVKRKPAPQTVDVLGSELRMGDVVVGVRDDNGRATAWVPKEVTGVWYARPEAVHRVRLPRPPGEPRAKAKCPTCRCMIVPGTTCACCESTSGDDPPLPSLDRDEEPSGEGIARFERARLVIGSDEWSLSDLQAHQPTSWVPRMVAAINAAHAHATRELRERCERAERELVSATNALTHERVLARAQNERCEHAERVVEAVRRWVHEGPIVSTVIRDALDDYDRARKAST